MSKHEKALSELEKHATEIRDDLGAADQSRVFALAIEAAVLAALSDGEIDADEKAALVRAVEILSKGAVIEWETETLVDEHIERAKKDGAEARAKAVGAALSSLGRAEAAVFVAGVVAAATGGVDKAEAEAIRAVATAAGIAADKTKSIIKRASAFAR